MLNSFRYTIKQAFGQVFRNKTMSIASVFSITAMLLILGIFFILVININMVTESVKADYDTIEVFMQEDARKALAILKDRWGDQGYLLDNLAKNPLPDSVVIKISSLEKAQAIADKAKTFNGIEKVNYYKQTVDKIMKVTDFIQLAALIIMAFLVIVSVVVVANTVKLTVFARGDEISIMKYIGATNWFVRGPFLVEGIIIGLFSAIISVLIIALIYARIIAGIGDDMMIMLSTPMVPEGFLVKNIIVIFVALGVSIGACGSIISMRRFLDV